MPDVRAGGRRGDVYDMSNNVIRSARRTKCCPYCEKELAVDGETTSAGFVNIFFVCPKHGVVDGKLIRDVLTDNPNIPIVKRRGRRGR